VPPEGTLAADVPHVDSPKLPPKPPARPVTFRAGEGSGSPGREGSPPLGVADGAPSPPPPPPPPTASPRAAARAAAAVAARTPASPSDAVMEGLDAVVTSLFQTADVAAQTVAVHDGAGPDGPRHQASDGAGMRHLEGSSSVSPTTGTPPLRTARDTTPTRPPNNPPGQWTSGGSPPMRLPLGGVPSSPPANTSTSTPPGLSARSAAASGSVGSGLGVVVPRLALPHATASMPAIVGAEGMPSGGGGGGASVVGRRSGVGGLTPRDRAASVASSAVGVPPSPAQGPAAGPSGVVPLSLPGRSSFVQVGRARSGSLSPRDAPHPLMGSSPAMVGRPTMLLSPGAAQGPSSVPSSGPVAGPKTGIVWRTRKGGVSHIAAIVPGRPRSVSPRAGSTGDALSPASPDSEGDGGVGGGAGGGGGQPLRIEINRLGEVRVTAIMPHLPLSPPPAVLSPTHRGSMTPQAAAAMARARGSAAPHSGGFGGGGPSFGVAGAAALGLGDSGADGDGAGDGDEALGGGPRYRSARSVDSRASSTGRTAARARAGSRADGDDGPASHRSDTVDRSARRSTVGGPPSSRGAPAAVGPLMRGGMNTSRQALLAAAGADTASVAATAGLTSALVVTRPGRSFSRGTALDSHPEEGGASRTRSPSKASVASAASHAPPADSRSIATMVAATRGRRMTDRLSAAMGAVPAAPAGPAPSSTVHTPSLSVGSSRRSQPTTVVGRAMRALARRLALGGSHSDDASSEGGGLSSTRVPSAQQLLQGPTATAGRLASGGTVGSDGSAGGAASPPGGGSFKAPPPTAMPVAGVTASWKGAPRAPLGAGVGMGTDSIPSTATGGMFGGASQSSVNHRPVGSGGTPDPAVTGDVSTAGGGGSFNSHVVTGDDLPNLASLPGGRGRASSRAVMLAGMHAGGGVVNPIATRARQAPPLHAEVLEAPVAVAVASGSAPRATSFSPGTEGGGFQLVVASGGSGAGKPGQPGAPMTPWREFSGDHGGVGKSPLAPSVLAPAACDTCLRRCCACCCGDPDDDDEETVEELMEDAWVDVVTQDGCCGCCCGCVCSCCVECDVYSRQRRCRRCWLLCSPLGAWANMMYVLRQIRIFTTYLVTDPWWERWTMAVILVSCVNLALDHPSLDACAATTCSTLASYLVWSDYTITAFFTAEILLQLVARGLWGGGHSFFADNWRILDLVVVAFSVAAVFTGTSTVRALRSLRAFRALRPLRVVSRFPRLRLVVNALFAALPRMTDVLIVVLVASYCFAVVGLQTFRGGMSGCSDPTVNARESCTGAFTPTGDLCALLPTAAAEAQCRNGVGGPWTSHRTWRPAYGNFDNIFVAMLTVFELTTGENWPSLMTNGVDSAGRDVAGQREYNPAAALFYLVAGECVGDMATAAGGSNNNSDTVQPPSRLKSLHWQRKVG